MLIFSVYVHFLVPQCLIPHIYLNGGQNQIQHCVCVCVCVYLVISDWWCCIKKQTRNWIQIRGYWIQKRERERETKRGCFFYTFSFFSDNNRIVFSGIEMMQFLSNHSWYIHSIYIYITAFFSFYLTPCQFTYSSFARISCFRAQSHLVDHQSIIWSYLQISLVL